MADSCYAKEQNYFKPRQLFACQYEIFPLGPASRWRLAGGEELFYLCAYETGDGAAAACGDDEDILVAGAVAEEGTD